MSAPDVMTLDEAQERLVAVLEALAADGDGVWRGDPATLAGLRSEARALRAVVALHEAAAERERDAVLASAGNGSAPVRAFSARGLGEVFASLAASMTTMPHDWALDHRFAWQWGIIVGWGNEALAEVAARHRWSEETVARLRNFRGAVEAVRRGAVP